MSGYLEPSKAAEVSGASTQLPRGQGVGNTDCERLIAIAEHGEIELG